MMLHFVFAALFETIRGYRLTFAMDKLETIGLRIKTGLEWADATECQSYAQCMCYWRIYLKPRVTTR